MRKRQKQEKILNIIIYAFVVYLTTVSVFKTSGHLRENSGVFILVLHCSGRNLTYSKFSNESKTFTVEDW
jgi:hypothetical protein